MRATGGWSVLSLILGSKLRRAVRELRGGRHLIETDLADLHSRVYGDWQSGDIGQLQSDVAFESGIDESCRRMNKKTKTAQRRLPLESGHDVVSQLDSLQRRPEHELAGVEHERRLIGDLDELGEVGLGGAGVDFAVTMIDEDPKTVAHPEIDRRRLDMRTLVGIDEDSARVDCVTDGAVGEDHWSRMVGVSCGAGEGNRTLGARAVGHSLVFCSSLSG